MKPGIRTGAGMVTVIALAIAALMYLANDRMSQAGQTAAEAREATLHTYRVAQSLKSLIHGYELVINEYYSTVLELPNYRKKAAETKTAIDGELAALARLNTGDATAVADLDAAFKEIEALRLELEAALSGEDKNWDLAREALYKLNVVAVRAVQPADRIAHIAGEQSVAMDAAWQGQQAQALRIMQIAMLLALVAGVLSGIAVFRAGRVPAAEV